MGRRIWGNVRRVRFSVQNISLITFMYRGTAGLGGAGGPYRLDSGNPVFQVFNNYNVMTA